MRAQKRLINYTKIPQGTKRTGQGEEAGPENERVIKREARMNE